MSSEVAQFIQLGYVAGAHGVRGAIRVKLFNVESTTLAPGVKVRLCPRDGDPANAESIAIERVAPKPGSEMCRLWFAGVGNRDAAEALRGRELWIDRAQLPALDEDEFYLADLIGLEVVREGAEGPEALGEITGVTTNTAQDLLCISLAGSEWLVPALAPFVVEIAFDRGQVVVDVDDEMLPESWSRRRQGARGES